MAQLELPAVLAAAEAARREMRGGYLGLGTEQILASLLGTPHFPPAPGFYAIGILFTDTMPLANLFLPFLLTFTSSAPRKLYSVFTPKPCLFQGRHYNEPKIPEIKFNTDRVYILGTFAADLVKRFWPKSN